MSGSTVRITPPLFRERLFHLHQLSKDVEVISKHLDNRISIISQKGEGNWMRESQYLLELKVELLRCFKYLFIHSTHRVAKTSKIQMLEIQMMIVIAKMKDYFEKNP